MLRTDINQILKLRTTIDLLVNIDDILKFDVIPVIYRELLIHCKITIIEYRLIKSMWYSKNQSLNNVEVGKLILELYNSDELTKRHRNSFYSSLQKLDKYGVVTYKKLSNSMISVGLSPLIFNRLAVYKDMHELNIYDLIYSTKGESEVMTENSVRIPIVGVRKSITDIREPITGIRSPIITQQTKDKLSNSNCSGRKINFNAKKYEGLTENEKKQLERFARFGQSYVDKQLQTIRRNSYSEMSKLEIDCVDNFVPYYENLICKTTGRIEYSLLDNILNKKLSKRWNPIFKCYMLCIENKYDWKVYLDAQFEAFKEWKNGSSLPYPMPNTLYSDRAIKAYENYIYHNETAYNNEGWSTKVTAENTGTYREETKKILLTNLDSVNNHIKYVLKRSFNRKLFSKVDCLKYDLDCIYFSKAVQSQWEVISPEFWTIIPEMSEFLKQMEGRYESVDLKITKYQEIVNNHQKFSIIKEISEELLIPKMYGVYQIDKILNS